MHEQSRYTTLYEVVVPSQRVLHFTLISGGRYGQGRTRDQETEEGKAKDHRSCPLNKGDGCLSSDNEEVTGCNPYPDRPRIRTVVQTGQPLGRAETDTEG